MHNSPSSFARGGSKSTGTTTQSGAKSGTHGEMRDAFSHGGSKSGGKTTQSGASSTSRNSGDQNGDFGRGVPQNTHKQGSVINGGGPVVSGTKGNNSVAFVKRP